MSLYFKVGVQMCGVFLTPASFFNHHSAEPNDFCPNFTHLGKNPNPETNIIPVGEHNSGQPNHLGDGTGSTVFNLVKSAEDNESTARPPTPNPVFRAWPYEISRLGGYSTHVCSTDLRAVLVNWRTVLPRTSKMIMATNTPMNLG